MLSRIREVRKAKKMTLAEVAARCQPPTTAQTIGRLETGTRTLSLAWLNRIAGALGVDAAELVANEETQEVEVAAILEAGGNAQAPTQRLIALPPSPASDIVALRVEAGIGDYRSGDEIWCRQLGPDDFGSALNKDVLVPRPAGRYIFGRLIDRQGGNLLILPPGAGSRQQVVKDPPWLATVETLVRKL
ncbi:helix-turn-helix domain-containing protein [Sphingomicrobium sediminis]|uniref:Helix-turn-helix transcriptional regulator n=1 Tax=Sphingomicrobium sediminis TaxID=2950949 RepID=A0A9X2J3G5_9SPHN|nr:helix-turn-helix transcriptional regulator [Sphingomicrobium sediminis]MCM8557276.1 helix-turn-helix transcriptional regulator [Sphingomicrobium sediminis]